MRILGVDPGLTRCGVGIVSTEGSRLDVVHVDVIRTDAAAELGDRLLAIRRDLERVLDTFVPDVVAIERVFAQHNVKTVMGTAQAGALAIVAATERSLPVTTYTPSEMKAAVTGNGRADKKQVTYMVTRILKLEKAPSPADAADALALAITHAWRGAAKERVRNAVAAGRR